MPMALRPPVLALLLGLSLALPAFAGPGPGGEDDRRDGRSDDVETHGDDAAECDEDETSNATTGGCERVERREGRDGDACVESESETENEETLPNGTRYRETSKTKTRDCPGTAEDETDVESETEWDEDSSGTGAAENRGRDRVRIERNHGLEVRIEHEAHGVDVSMRDNATVLELREPRSDRVAIEVAFLELLEFEDVNGDGAFDLDDRILRAFRVADLSAGAETLDGVATVTYALPPGGSLAFRHRAEIDREKFDVVLDGYSYSSSTSYVALRAAFIGESASFRSDLRAPALVSTSAGRAAYLDWVPAAAADGVEQPVFATVYVGGAAAAGTAQLYLTYPRGEIVVHDPAVGFLDIQSLAPVVQVLFDGPAYVMAAGAAVAFLAAGFLARRRN
ncbi:MAG TPA: hypothetical protein VI997_02470 [Candidatus Thermoplasmatota archaeon]|nr:hypothetical protein [Candidatus Thermoplasmatota archaeon]